MRQGEPLLIICQGFPPNSGIGGRRWAKFAKELARRGYAVHVIRSAGEPAYMTSLWTQDANTPGVIAHPLPTRYPNIIHTYAATSLKDRLSYHVWMRLLPILTKQNCYDRGIFWRKQLLRKASELIRSHGIRNVVVTGAPFSLMAFAAELKKPFPEINLIADFRDIWTWGIGYGMESLSPRRLEQEKRMEALVLDKSDRITSPHATVIDHLRSAYNGDPHRYVVIPHAIDPDDLDGTQVASSDGSFRMIYAGSLYGADEAQDYFNSLLNALDTVRREKPEAYENCFLDLYITGHDTTAYERQVKDFGMSDHIRFHAPLPPKEISKRIVMSDLVLNFFPYDKKDVLATKFNEIFYLRRPVLHIGEPGLVSRTIKERRLGDSLRVEELVTELPRIITGERRIEIDRNADHSEYLLANITDRLVNEVFV